MKRTITYLLLLGAGAVVAPAQSSIPESTGSPVTSRVCVISYKTLSPADPSTTDDTDLQQIPVGVHDDDLACAGSVQSIHTPMGLQSAEPASVTGWTVVAGSVREFQSLDNIYMFSIAAVRDPSGRQGVLLSRGIYITAGGKKVLNWERRVITNDQLVEYNTQPAGASIFDWITDLWNYFVDKLLPVIEDEFGKLISDAIKSLFKQLDKWLQKEISKLFEKGGSSQVPKLLLSQMQINGSSNKTVERYVTSVISSRSSNLTKSDRVFVSLSQPVTLTGDVRAGKALSKAIESLR